MKRIRYLDNKTDTFVTCFMILRHLTTWKYLIMRLEEVNSVVNVYQKLDFSARIFVKFEGYNYKNKRREYSFIYVSEKNCTTSYKFWLSNSGEIKCDIKSVTRACFHAKRRTYKNLWADDVEKLKNPGEMYHVGCSKKIKKSFRDKFIFWGNKEFADSTSYAIKYIGQNPKNGHREYIFVCNNKDDGSKFEIIDD